MDAPAVARALEAWFAREGRDLPWRARRGDPYAVWLSEAMLQQTRVETVLGRYEAMLRRFPDAAALAASAEAEVLAAWEGLGYYRRARQLHAAARRIVSEHGGRLPDDPAALARLPGFGPYMTAAVASIAFGRPLAATDANAVRVLARLALLAAPAGSAALMARARALHQKLVGHSADAGALNQALMDLGARVCVRRPRCELCPVRGACRAFAAGGAALAARYPQRRPRRARPVVDVAVAVVTERGGRVLAAERPAGLLGGLWGLPMVERPADGAPAAEAEALRAALVAALARDWGAPPGLEANGLRPREGFAWGFTHRLWRVRVYALAVEQPFAPARGAWLGPQALASAGFGGPFRAALSAAGATGSVPSRRSASPAGPG